MTGTPRLPGPSRAQQLATHAARERAHNGKHARRHYGRGKASGVCAVTDEGLGCNVAMLPWSPVFGVFENFPAKI